MSIKNLLMIASPVEGEVFTVDVGTWQGIDWQTHRGFERYEGVGSITPNTFSGKEIRQVIFMATDEGIGPSDVPPFAQMGSKIALESDGFDSNTPFEIKMIVKGGPNGTQEATLEVLTDGRTYMGDAVSVYPEGEHHMVLIGKYKYEEPITVAVRNLWNMTYTAPIVFTSDTGDTCTLTPGAKDEVVYGTISGNYLKSISSSEILANGDTTVNLYLDREESFDFAGTSVNDVDSFQNRDIPATKPWDLQFEPFFARYRSVCFNIMMTVPSLPV